MFTTVNLGSMSLRNRFIMAPLTRCRATMPGNVPNALMAQYYAQRASCGLIIAEATMAIEGHNAFFSEPGVYSSEQVEGWKLVTDAVHKQGGLIVLQLYTPGRAACQINTGNEAIAPSPVVIEGMKIQAHFSKTREALPYYMPRELKDDELEPIIEGFAQAARNSIAAGFDGVEVHGANGYLIDQFLRDSSNKRTYGNYGGSLDNRCRFLVEVCERVCKAIGSGRVGLRLSPLNSYNGQIDTNPELLYTTLATKLNSLNLAYLHLMRADFFQTQKGDAVGWLSSSYKGNLVVNMGYDYKEATEAVTNQGVKAVAFGSKVLANPDFVERCEKGLELAEVNQSTVYGQGALGYTDYPFAKGTKT